MSLLYDAEWPSERAVVEALGSSSPDSAKCLLEFGEDAAVLPLHAFARRHGDAFLLRVARDGVLMPAPHSERTGKRFQTQAAGSLFRHLDSCFGDADEVYVYSLGQLMLRAATIGRAPSNLVCIDDLSVSTHHAVVHADAAGQLCVTDVGSKNGTVVGEKTVSRFAPHHVPFGKRLAFGTVDLVLMPAEQFAGLAKVLAAAA